MLRCLVISALIILTAPGDERAAAQDARVDNGKEKPITERESSETDAQLVERAFQHLARNPAKAAEVASSRLRDESILRPEHRARLLWIAGSGLAITGRHPEAMEFLEEGECIAHDLQDRRMLRRILRYIAASACELAMYQRGQSAAEEALEISRELQDQSGYTGILHSELANNASSLGDTVTAARHYRAALKIADDTGNQKLSSMILANLAHLYVDQQQYDAAIEMHQRSLSLARQQNLPLVVATVQLNLAESMLKAGRPEEANELYLELLQLEDNHIYAAIKAGAHQGMGDLFLGKERRQEAKHHFETALALWTKLQQPEGIVAVEQRLAVLNHPATLRNEAQQNETLQKLERALESAREIRNPQMILSICEQLIQQHMQDGNWQQAAELQQEAITLQSDLWKESAMKELASVQTEMRVLEHQQANDELLHNVSLQQAKLLEQRRLMLILTTGLSLMLIVLLILWRTLAAKRQVIADLQRAEAEIRRQKQIQLAIERRLAEEQRAESLAVMAAGIAHDFNNLLTIIAGLSELGHYRNDAQQKDELFTQISAATLQAADLTSQLLQFLGRPAVKMECVDLCSIVSSAQGLLSSLVRTRAELRIEVSDEPLWTCIQSGQIQQILINLISNAADAMSAPAEIVVSTSRQYLTSEQLAGMRHGEQTSAGDFCLLQVSDSGVGIPIELQSRIFDPYFSTKANGRGLGLASVLGIVRSCGGAIQVDSKPPEIECTLRTTVSVYLPLQTDPDHAGSLSIHPPTQTDQTVAPLPGSRCSVLLVDDEQRVLNYVSQILQTAGYRVLTAEDAQTALAQASAHSAELCCVVTDYTMPGKDGVWLASRIGESLPELPVVICSGYGPDQVATEGHLYTFLQKPYRPQELLQTINYLSRRYVKP